MPYSIFLNPRGRETMSPCSISTSQPRLSADLSPPIKSHICVPVDKGNSSTYERTRHSLTPIPNFLRSALEAPAVILLDSHSTRAVKLFSRSSVSFCSLCFMPTIYCSGGSRFDVERAMVGLLPSSTTARHVPVERHGTSNHIRVRRRDS